MPPEAASLKPTYLHDRRESERTIGIFGEHLEWPNLWHWFQPSPMEKVCDHNFCWLKSTQTSISPRGKGIEEDFWYLQKAFREADRLAPVPTPSASKRQRTKFRPITVEISLNSPEELAYSNFDISAMEEDGRRILVSPEGIRRGRTFGTGPRTQHLQTSTSKISANQIWARFWHGAIWLATTLKGTRRAV